MFVLVNICILNETGNLPEWSRWLGYFRLIFTYSCLTRIGLFITVKHSSLIAQNVKLLDWKIIFVAQVHKFLEDNEKQIGRKLQKNCFRKNEKN